MLVVVDEAQLFAPAVAGEVSDEARKLSLGAMTNLMCRGRKRGLAGVIATQRLAKLAKNVAAEASNFLMGRTFLDIDMARAADLLGMERRQAEMFRDLERGQFVALGPALSRRPLPVAHRRRWRPPARCASPEADAAARGRRRRRARLISPRRRVKTRSAPPPPPPPPPPTADMLAQLARAAPPAPARRARRRACRPERARGARSMTASCARCWATPTPASARRRCSIRIFWCAAASAGCRGEPLSLPAFRRRLAVARAGIELRRAGPTSRPGHEVLAMARPRCRRTCRACSCGGARGASTRRPCPSDADVASAYGTPLARAGAAAARLYGGAAAIVCRLDLRG